jgi:hypothetical protein
MKESRIYCELDSYSQNKPGVFAHVLLSEWHLRIGTAHHTQ